MIDVDEYRALSARDMAAAVQDGRLSALDLAQTALHLAESTGRDLNAFVTVCRDAAIQRAEVIDALPVEDRRGLPLAGVPIALKDNLSYTGCPMTCGSRILDGYIPPYDATVVTKLLEAGAVIVGKTNMDEFAMGSSSEYSAFGPVRNPVASELSPGGSSGGSAAAVAAGIVPVALGSDTGGSVRQPAAFCGVYGLKPTYGSVSRYGLTAFVSSTDQVSPLARSVEDLIVAFSTIVGDDDRDATTVNRPQPDFLDELYRKKTFRIGVPIEYRGEGLESQIDHTIDQVASKLERAGHTATGMSLTLTDKALASYYVIAAAEASANLARYDGVRYGRRSGRDESLAKMYADTRTSGFGDEVKRRIMLGTYALSEGYYDQYYMKASRVRELISREFDYAFGEVDLLLTPATPTLPFRLGEKAHDPLAMYLSDVYTVPASLAGIPAIVLPAGSAKDGRPIGVQFMANRFRESMLFQIAHSLAEQAI